MVNNRRVGLLMYLRKRVEATQLINKSHSGRKVWYQRRSAPNLLNPLASQTFRLYLRSSSQNFVVFQPTTDSVKS